MKKIIFIVLSCLIFQNYLGAFQWPDFYKKLIGLSWYPKYKDHVVKPVKPEDINQPSSTQNPFQERCFKISQVMILPIVNLWIYFRNNYIFATPYHYAQHTKKVEEENQKCLSNLSKKIDEVNDDILQRHKGITADLEALKQELLSGQKEKNEKLEHLKNTTDYITSTFALRKHMLENIQKSTQGTLQEIEKNEKCAKTMSNILANINNQVNHQLGKICAPVL